ncbi:MAG: sigma-70 family RNA polymerase sigma factor [Methyloprofundus sp.]|nr:sigma-70 family RNA polymerase sigma factor [Methyloprofundus sp.]
MTEMSIDEIAEQLGMTRKQVLQIHYQAVKKCRLWCKRKGIKFNDLLDGGEVKEHKSTAKSMQSVCT